MGGERKVIGFIARAVVNGTAAYIVLKALEQAQVAEKLAVASKGVRDGIRERLMADENFLKAVDDLRQKVSMVNSNRDGATS